MKKILLAGLLLALWAGHAEAQSTCVGFPNGVKPRATTPTETIAVSSTSVALTTPTGADMAVLTFDGTNKIRFWPSGDPTAGVGHLVDSTSPNISVLICGRQLMGTFRMIRVTNDATVSVSYYVGN